MCPPAPVPPPVDIPLYWTDGEIFISLEKIIHGSPLPGNVIPDENPYQVMPSKLHEGAWYFVHSDDKKDTEVGFWKAKGEASDIFQNSAIIGWRTTHEFYEGQVPHGRRTSWVMQEYRITQKGPCDHGKTEDPRLLCRVFCSDGQSPVHELASKHRSTGQGSTNESQEKNSDDGTGPLAVVERFEDTPVENLLEVDCILGGDFLELNDLADPESPSSSSDNSSCLTFSSDECFDSLALLQELDQGKESNFKYLSASLKSNEVFVDPPTLGSLIGGNGSKLPEEGTLPRPLVKGELLDKRAVDPRIISHQANEGTSNSQNVPASSSNPESISERKRKALVGRMKKLKKKYLCFMPF